MNDLPGNYDAWRCGTFGRFEREQERRDEKYSDALSERDSELREGTEILAEVFADAIDDPPNWQRLAGILQAAALRKPPREIGEALTRLVQDVIDTEARRYAEEEAK